MMLQYYMIMSERYDNLLRFTEAYKMLFIPYLKLEKPIEYSLIYGKVISRSIINVFPAWRDVDATIEHGFLYLVLNRDLLDEDSTEFNELINLSIIEDYWLEDELIILACNIPIDLATKYFNGEFSQIFDKVAIMRIWQLFRVKSGGIMTPVPAGQSQAKLAKEYHILIRSRQYEKIIAAQLEIPYKEFEGELKELKSRLSDDIASDTLDTKLLIKQLKKNGNT